MSILPSDGDGFLTGTVSENLEKIAREIAVLKAIRSDTHATLAQLRSIANSLGSVRVEGPAPSNSAPPAPPVIPPDRPSRRNSPAPGAPPGAPSDGSPRPAPSPRPVPPPQPPDRDASPTPAPDRQRDESGRWRRRNAGPDGAPGPDASGSDKESRAAGALGDAADTLKGVASAVGSGTDGIDPTVQAVKEIGGIVAPVAGVLKPMGRLFGIGKRPEQKSQRENVSWYRRIWGAVKNPAGGRGGGMGLLMTALLSTLGMLLAPIKALSKLMGLPGLLKSALSMLGLARGGSGGARGGRSGGGGGGRGGRGGDGGPTPPDTSRRGARNGPNPPDTNGRRNPPRPPTPPGGRGGGLGGMAKGLLKKLPFIGALIGGAMLASDVMASDDPNLTPEENKKQRYGNVGSGVGGLVGGALGLFGGPAGAIAGAMIGDQLGGMVGTWLATVDLGSIPGKISDAFTTLKDGALDAAKGAFDSVKSGWNGLVESGAKVFTGMSDWAKDTWKAATDAVMGIKDTVADKVQTAKDYVGDKATSVKDAGQNLLNKATGGKYTGGSNAAKDEMIKAMDAGGITDPKSKAMLMANVDHESGGFKKNEENLNYSAKRLQEVFPKYYKTPEDARADANNPEAIANKVYGGRMGNTEAGDGYKYRGRGNLQLTGKAQYAEMGKKLGIDLVNNPDLAMDPKYSAQIAVQHWKSSGADKAAQAGDQTRARKLTNGGTNGLEDVNSKYDAYLAQAKAGDLTPTRRADEGKVQAPAAASTAIASTMATVKGAPAGAKPITPGMPGANTVGIMVAPATAPTLATKGVTSISPVSAGTLVAPRYTPPAPEAAQMKIPATPAVEKPMMMANKPAAPTTIQMSVPLSQNLEDRQIAHVAGGGVGMG